MGGKVQSREFSDPAPPARRCSPGWTSSPRPSPLLRSNTPPRPSPSTPHPDSFMFVAGGRGMAQKHAPFFEGTRESNSTSRQEDGENVGWKRGGFPPKPPPHTRTIRASMRKGWGEGEIPDGCVEAARLISRVISEREKTGQKRDASSIPLLEGKGS